MISDLWQNFRKYFIVWWFPIVVYLIAIALFILGLLLRRDLIIDIFLIVFILNTIGLIISAIVQVFIKKWYFIIPQIGIGYFLFNYFSMIFIYSPPDFYGAHKTIPKDIEIYKPFKGEPTLVELDKYDLVISEYIQPGIYKYHTDYKPKETGYFYINAFEINSNDKLSENRIKKRSKIKVDKLEQNKLFSGEFTIYEGSWDDKYGSRIELWFQPSNGNRAYKITERNYIIEGWMR